MFRLTAEEYEGLKLQDIAKSNNNLKLQSSNPDNISLRSQNVTLNKGRGKHKKYFPYTFTEQGVSMLAAVLRSETAINTSIRIMDAFVEMRKYLLANAGLLQRIETVEIRQAEADRKVEAVLNTIGSRSLEQKQGIFFKGQIYDAYSFVIGLIKTAKEQIVIIDNYINDSLLDMLSKKAKSVRVIIITNKNKINKTDIDKFNSQYPKLSIRLSREFHDRFLIIDGHKLYHIGASLKDLGRKCFAFSVIENSGLLQKLNNNIRDNI